MAAVFIRSCLVLLLLSLTACIAEPAERVQADPPPESPLPEESTEEEETGMEEDEEESPGDELTGPPDGYDVTLYGLHVTPDPVTTHATFSVQFTAPVEAELTYLWHFAGVTIGTGQSVEWTHRGLPGIYELRVEAADQYGLTYTADTLLEISSPHPWPAYQRDAQHTGHLPFPGTATGAVGWEIDFLPYTTPLVGAGDIVYAMGATGYLDEEHYDFIEEEYGLAKIAPEGNLTWLNSSPLFGPANAMALSADGRFYIAHRDGVTVLDLDGEILWSWEHEGDDAIRPSLVVAPDGTVYAGPFDGALVALAHDSDTLLWSASVGDYMRIPVIAPDGTVVVAFAASFMYMSLGYQMHALLPGGQVRWEKELGQPEGSFVYEGIDQPVLSGERIHADDTGTNSWGQTGVVKRVFSLDGDEVNKLGPGYYSGGPDQSSYIFYGGHFYVLDQAYDVVWGVSDIFHDSNGPLLSSAEGSAYFLSTQGLLKRLSADPSGGEFGVVDWTLQLPGGSLYQDFFLNPALDSRGRLIGHDVLEGRLFMVE